jgi:hypothetical protein
MSSSLSSVIIHNSKTQSQKACLICFFSSFFEEKACLILRVRSNSSRSQTFHRTRNCPQKTNYFLFSSANAVPSSIKTRKPPGSCSMSEGRSVLQFVYNGENHILNKTQRHLRTATSSVPFIYLYK